MGRNPDPSSAYREAIRAVEVVAAPVVIPGDSLATLGKIIKAMKDKPEKWTVDLAEASPQQVTELAAMIWQSQFEHHFAVVAADHMLMAIERLDPPIPVEQSLSEGIADLRDMLEHWLDNMPVFNQHPRPRPPAHRSGKALCSEPPGPESVQLAGLGQRRRPTAQYDRHS